MFIDATVIDLREFKKYNVDKMGKIVLALTWPQNGYFIKYLVYIRLSFDMYCTLTSLKIKVT